MGNSTSLEPEEDFGALPDDVFDLKDVHFKCLWKHYPLTAHQVTQAARSIPLAKRDSVSGLYIMHQQQQDEEQSKEAALAIRLCQLLPELATLRFQLVPGRIKESRFWQAVLILLKERLVDYNARQYDNDDDDDDEEEFIDDYNDALSPNNSQERQRQTTTEEPTTPTPHMNGHTPATTTNDENGFGNTNHHHANELKVKNDEIKRLQQQVKELQEALANATTTTSKNGNAANNSQQHKGIWRRDKDSQEFLEYPQEVKDSLRAEKQRRLQQVKDEMKFILDSDADSDSYGKWECCGATKYSAQCKYV